MLMCLQFIPIMRQTKHANSKRYVTASVPVSNHDIKYTRTHYTMSQKMADFQLFILGSLEREK